MNESFDSELDGQIRSMLGRLDNAAPMPPPLSSLRRTHASVPARRLGVAAVSLAVVGAGVAGVVALRPDSAAAPGAPVSTPDSAGASSPAIVDTAPASPVSEAPSSEPETSSSRSAEEFIDDDVFLLANLYTMSGVATAAEIDTAASFNRSEDEVAGCMVAAGWQYEPDPPFGDPRAGLSVEEFASRYGFGIVSNPTYEVSPNVEYVASLSPGQSAAYHSALFACQERGPDSPRWGFTNAWNVAFDQFREDIDADERVIGAVEDWRQCMAAAGYEYPSPNAMRGSFYTRMNSMSGDEREQLAIEERATAVANVPCQGDLDDVYRDVIAERFDEFKELLDEAWESGTTPDGQGWRGSRSEKVLGSSVR